MPKPPPVAATSDEGDHLAALRLLWDECVIGLAEVAEDGSFLRANPAFCDLVGYAEAELQERDVQSITHPGDLAGDLAMLRSLTNGQRHRYTMAKRYITKQGGLVWIALHVHALRGTDGELRFFIVQAKPLAEILPARLPGDEELRKAIWRTNAKWIVGAMVGTVLAVAGSITRQDSLVTTGLALLTGIFGGYVMTRGR